MRTDRRTLLVMGAAVPLMGCTAAMQALPRVGGIDRLDPAFDAVVDPASPVEVLGTGYRWAEGPAWSRAGGFLAFSDVPANIAYRWTRQEGVRPWLEPSGIPEPVPEGVREGGSNGLAFARDGRLLVANSGGRSVDAIDAATRRRTVLADRYEGRRFNSVNDLVEARNGAIFFTDPPYGLDGGDESALKEQAHNGVYRLDRGGRVTLLDGEQSRPNGIALSPDERTLYVALSEEASPRILAYDLDATGAVSNRRVFIDLGGVEGPGLPDGLKTDRDGRVYATGPGGVHVLAPDGRRLGLISTGKAVANAGFGEDCRSLFLTSSDMLARVRLRASGW